MRALAALLLAAFAATLFALTARVGSTVDEPMYVNAGAVIWRTGQWDTDYTRLHGPLPLLANQLLLRGEGEVLRPATLDATLIAARRGELVFALLCALGVYLWSRRVFGERAGLFSLALFVTNPLMLGYGALATVDMAYSALLVWTWFLAWSYLRGPTLARLVATGLLLGLAFATKYLALLHGPPVVLVVAGSVLLARRRAGASLGRAAAAALGAAALLTGLALVALHGAYGFRVGCASSDPSDYVSTLLPRALELPVLSHFLALFPDAYVQGADYQLRAAGSGWSYFTNGRIAEGHPLYYVLTFLVKTPELLLLLTLWLVLRGAPRMLAGRAGANERSAAFVLALAIALPLFYLSASKLQLGVRYALPAYPLLFVWLGGVARDPWVLARAGRTRLTAALGLILLLGASTAAQWPNLVGYYNLASGGPAAGREYFTGSNSDWGQMRAPGLALLKDPERRPDALAGRGELRELGRDAGPQFGLLAVYLANLVRPDPEDRTRAYHWTDVFDPVAHVDAAWWVFDTRPREYERAVEASGSERHRAELALAYLASGELEAAERHAERLTGERRTTLRDALALTRRCAAPATAADLGALARFWAEHGRFDTCLELLRRDDAAPLPRRALLMAQALKGLHREEEAVPLLEADPNLASDPAAIVLLANLYARAYQHEAAANLLERHIATLRRALGARADELLERRRAIAREWRSGMAEIAGDAPRE